MMSDVRRLIMREFASDREQTISRLAASTDIGASEISAELRKMKAEGVVDTVGRTGWVILQRNINLDENPLIPSGIVYLDHSGLVSKLRKCYNMKLNVIIIGPAGVGKTVALMKLAEIEGVPIHTTNFSIRTREHHFMGRLDTNPDGTIYFKHGPLVRAMVDGGIFYGDEINCAESDALVKLDSALDFRRAVEIEGEFIRAHDKFWSCASINPLDRYHPGTKELPGQLLSRFPVRIHIDYPGTSEEYAIVKMHVPEIGAHSGRFLQFIAVMQQLRDNLDLPYHPTLRESITLARLIVDGMPEKEALLMSLVDVYSQWGRDTMVQVGELIESRLGIKFFDSDDDRERKSYRSMRAVSRP